VASEAHPSNLPIFRTLVAQLVSSLTISKSRVSRTTQESFTPTRSISSMARISRTFPRCPCPLQCLRPNPPSQQRLRSLLKLRLPRLHPTPKKSKNLRSPPQLRKKNARKKAK